MKNFDFFRRIELFICRYVKGSFVCNQTHSGNRKTSGGGFVPPSFSENIPGIAAALLLVFCFALNSRAQEVMPLNDAIVNFSGAEESPTLESLVSDLHPAIYLENGTAVIPGDDNREIVVAYSDVASINTLYTQDPDFAMVKLLRIDINNQNETGAVLDLGRLSGFSELEYVVFLFTYEACGSLSDECLEGTVLGMITGENENLTAIVYQLSIPR